MNRGMEALIALVSPEILKSMLELDKATTGSDPACTSPVAKHSAGTRYRKRERVNVDSMLCMI